MTRRVAVHAVHVVLAAALLRAGVAGACPTPPGGSGTNQCTLSEVGEQDCSPRGALDLDVAIRQGARDASTGHWVVKLKATRNYGWASGVNGGVNVCDAMVLFRVSDDAEQSDLTVGLQGSSGTPLRNVRITNVEPYDTPNATGDQALRFGSGAFCVWATEDRSVAGYGPEVFRVTVEAFDPQGNVHKGQALVDMTCTVSATGATSQPAYYQWDVNADGTREQLNAEYCGHMNTECVADAGLPATCGPADVCQCSDTTPPPDAGTPAVPGTVCVNGGDRVLCGPLVPTVPGTPPGEVCVSNAETVVCGPVSVCVSAPGGLVCGPATGPGTTSGEVCISNAETIVCGPVAGSGSGAGDSGGDVCVSNAETIVCGPVAPGGAGTDAGCVSNAETIVCDPDGGSGSGASSTPGRVCVAAGGTTCGQVPVASSSSGAAGSAGDTSGSSGTSTSTGVKTGCAAFPGANLGVVLVALLGLGALRRRR